jgi:hypothetical protein
VNSFIKTIKVYKSDADQFIASYEKLVKNKGLTTLRLVTRRRSSVKRRQSIAAVAPVYGTLIKTPTDMNI